MYPRFTKMKLVLSSILLFASVLLNAQIKPNGYIVNTNNDTIHGTIKLHNEYRCIFTPQGESKAKKYFPNDLKIFRYYNGSYLVSKKLMFKDKVQHIFVEYLVNGEVDLWYAYPYYYLQVNKDTVLALKDGSVEFQTGTDKNKETYTRKDKRYVGILNYAMHDYPEISEKTKDITLDKTSLINLTVDYHEKVCSGQECIVYSKKIKKRKVLVSAGLSAEYEILSSYKNSNLSIYGIESNILIYSNGRCRFIISPSFKYIKYSISNSIDGSEKYNNTKNFSTGLKINYKLLKSMVSPTCGLGWRAIPYDFVNDLSINVGVIWQLSSYFLITTEICRTTSKSTQYSLALSFYFEKNKFVK